MDAVPRIAVVILAALGGYFVGTSQLVSVLMVGRVNINDHPELAVEYRLPHAVPKDPGGLAFRFAMVHDVLHERYPKHGPAHYERRNADTRAKLAALAPDDPAAFPLTDDLAAGLSRLGRNAEAAALMRAKLKRQEAKGLAGRDLYTSYANLGTFLMLDSLGKAAAGDAAAVERFRESVDLIRKSVEVNPASHFGREQWQLVFGEFVLAAVTKPDVLRTFDFIGNRLDKDVNPAKGRAAETQWRTRLMNRLEDPDPDPLKIIDPEQIKHARNTITTVGAEDGWEEVPVMALREPVAFDEPCLGIVGMWRQGGGPNPFFALCLGETMLRVGQRHIAWAAFERAALMAPRFWPDPTTRDLLRDHCARRQQRIADSLPAAEAAELRPRFDAELAFGEAYQREYQQYEAAKLAAGADPADPHFWDEFERGREPIASPSGPEEWYAVLDRDRGRATHQRRNVATGLLVGGVFALIAVVPFRTRRPAPVAPPA